jgi:hypothetical protein
MREVNDIHVPFKAWLNERRIPYVYHRTDRKSGIQEGHPDFTILWMRRQIMIECKTAGGKLSPKQVERIDFLRRSGNVVEIARSLSECVEAAYMVLCEGKPSTEAHGACNYPLEGCFKELKRAVAAVPGNGKNNLPVPVLAESPTLEKTSGEARESTRGGIEPNSRGGHPLYEKTKNENCVCEDERKTLRALREDRDKTETEEQKEMESHAEESSSSGFKNSSSQQSARETGRLPTMPEINPCQETSRTSHELHGASDSGMDLSGLPPRRTSSVGGGQNFYIGDWQRTPYVFAPDIDGNYKMIRKASVIDIANLPKLP